MTQAPGQRFITRDAQDLAKVAARWLAGRIARKSGRFSIALCGGRTPLSLYQLLGSPAWASTLDWSRVHVFWGDERLVPHDDPASNAGAARTAWLDRVQLPRANIHPMPAGPTPDAAALLYTRALQRFYGATALEPDRPLFDVVLLGVGADGHTASLFPDDADALASTAWTYPVARPSPPERLTLTLPILRSARAVAFMAAGEDKRDIVARLSEGDDTLPAGRVHGQEETVWFLDRAAAGSAP